MSIQKTLLGVITSSLLFGTSVWAQEAGEDLDKSENPFDISTKRCNDDNLPLNCFNLKIAPGYSYTVGEMSVEMEVSIERLRLLNGWTDQVTAETEIENGSKVAFSGKL